jgi:hypothetical protein
MQGSGGAGLVAQPRTASQIGPVWHVADAGGPSELYRAVLKPQGRLGRKTVVQGLPRAKHCSTTTGRSANPMPFPRIPQGDTISVMSRRLGRAKRFVKDLFRRRF